MSETLWNCCFFYLFKKINPGSAAISVITIKHKKLLPSASTTIPNYFSFELQSIMKFFFKLLHEITTNYWFKILIDFVRHFPARYRCKKFAYSFFLVYIQSIYEEIDKNWRPISVINKTFSLFEHHFSTYIHCILYKKKKKKKKKK